MDYWLQHSPAKLEQLILKLDWMCLDLNQVLKAVKRHKLYRAQLYLNACALNDYTAPLMELLPQLTPEQTDLGNCLLVYVSSCLAGRRFPSGDIPADQVHQVKNDVLRCLTSQHSSSSPEDELPYPYLRALLKFDTRETLNVISLAFQEREFNNELGFLHRKRIIYQLLEIMTPENATVGSSFLTGLAPITNILLLFPLQWAEIGCLLNFIAQQMSTQCLPRDRQLLERVLSYLAQEQIANETARQHSERESAWHELLSNNCLADISSDEEQLQLAERASCYYVVEYLLEKLQRYDNILECYIKNPLRHETMFAYMERHVREKERAIYAQLVRYLPQLLEINAEETTRLIALHYPEQIDELLELLSSQKPLLFRLLQCLNARHSKLRPEQLEKLLQLYCELETPEAVLEFLRGSQGYRLDKAIAIVEQHQLNRAVIYLYEQQESYAKAFDLSMELLKAADAEAAPKEAKEIAELLARSAQTLPEKELERCWFTLLQYILPQQELQSITKSMLHEASQHIDLHNLVQLIMNTHNVSSSFGDIKDLLMGMLISSRQQTEALRVAADELCENLHSEFVEQRKVARRGLWVTSMRCQLCRQRLYDQTEVIVLGSCGHALHQRCIDEADEEVKQCPRCAAELPQQEPVRLPCPGQSVLKGYSRQELGTLQLKAPPRRFC